MITNVIYAVLVLGVIAVVFGLILSVAAKAFEVKVDERLPKIQACLAGANWLSTSDSFTTDDGE